MENIVSPLLSQLYKKGEKKMKRNQMKKMSFLLFLSLALVGCGPLTPAETDRLEQATTKIPSKYRMNFYTDGGSLITSYLKEAGEMITKPDNPTKNGYRFIGWYRDYGTYQNEYATFTTMPAENITLYAKWEKVDRPVVDPDEYEAEIMKYSKADHLYIHYYRFENTEADYDQWNLWIWQHKPNDLSGREVNWMEENGHVKYDEHGGAVAELDLTQTYQDGGNEGGETVYFYNDGQPCEEIGFLLVYKSSKNSGDHWKSDGGNKYFPLADAKWEDGSYHIFATQDNVNDFTYHYQADKPVNPYENDDGTNTSAKYDNVNFNQTKEKAATANEFYQNVGTGYQVMVASFADSDGDGMGDIKGITDHLDYFSNVLHINALWLTPIQQSDSYHGYDISDYCAVDRKFGSKTTNFPELLDEKGRPTEASAMADYEELLRRAEEKGIKIVMDLVINHTSINNIWFQKSTSLVEEYRGYYQWRNHETETLSKDWHAYSTYRYSYYGKFASSMPELNYSYQGTRDAIVDVGLFWLEKGVSGFRIDAVKHIYMADETTKASGDVILSDFDTATNTDYSSNLTKNLHFFREFNARLKAVYPNAFIVGENFDGHAYRVAPYYEGLDSMLNFYMYYNLSQVAVSAKQNWWKAKTISGSNTAGAGTFTPGSEGINVQYGGTWDYPSTLATYNKYRGDNKAIDSIFTSNHDVARMMNNMVGTMGTSDVTPGTVTTANAQNGLKLAKVYAATVMTLPGISWIYYGDELGMSGNNQDQSTAHADRWYRQPFKWAKTKTDETVEFSFSGDKSYKIEWDNYNAVLNGVAEQKADTNSLLQVYRDLTQLKSSTKALINGTYTAVNIANAGEVFAFKRVGSDGTYYCFQNYGASAISISGYGSNVIYTLNGATASSLPAYSAIVIKA